MLDLEENNSYNITIEKKWWLDKIRKIFWDKLTDILEYSVSILQEDNKKLNELMWCFDLLWWKRIADKIDIKSEQLTKNTIEFGLITWNIPYQLTERQRKKAITILLWIILIYFARQRNNSSWTMDADIDYSDITWCINNFSIDDELFSQSVDFARKHYKNYFNWEIPKCEMKLEYFIK